MKQHDGFETAQENQCKHLHVKLQTLALGVCLLHTQAGSLSCHFTAPQVSHRQTDASPATSSHFAAHSIAGHTHIQTHTQL